MLWSTTTFRAAVAMSLATSSCNSTDQEHRSITHCFATRRGANAFCQSRLQTRIAGASQQIGKVRAASTMGTTPRHSEHASFFSLSHALFSDIEARNCRNPTSATPGATIPLMTQGLTAETVFTAESHTLPVSFTSIDMRIWLT